MSKTIVITLPDDVTENDISRLLVEHAKSGHVFEGGESATLRARQCSGLMALGNALARLEQEPEIFELSADDFQRAGDAMRTWSAERSQLLFHRLRGIEAVVREWKPTQGEETRGTS